MYVYVAKVMPLLHTVCVRTSVRARVTTECVWSYTYVRTALNGSLVWSDLFTVKLQS